MKTLPTPSEADTDLRECATIMDVDAYEARLVAFMAKQHARRYRYQQAGARINRVHDRLGEAWQAKDALGDGFLRHRVLRLRFWQWRMRRLPKDPGHELYSYIHLLARVQQQRLRLSGPNLKDADFTPGSGKKLVTGKVTFVGEDKDGNHMWTRITKKGGK